MSGSQRTPSRLGDGAPIVPSPNANRTSAPRVLGVEGDGYIAWLASALRGASSLSERDE